MRQVKILSGISGSGKSVLAGKLILAYTKSLDLTLDQIIALPKSDPRATVTYCSADTFFMKDGVYTFNPSDLSNAHGACFRAFIAGVQGKSELVVVDNTNLSSEEIAPYILGAQAFGCEAEILTLRLPALTSEQVVRLSDRNAHGVSPNNIMSQHDRLMRRNLMPWWKNTDMSVEGL